MIKPKPKISTLCLVFSRNSWPCYQLSLRLHSYPKCLITLGSILCNISIFISPNTRIGHLQGHTILIVKTLERKEIKKWSPVIPASAGENTLFTLVQWTTKNTCSFDIKKASNFIFQDPSKNMRAHFRFSPKFGLFRMCWLCLFTKACSEYNLAQ